MSLNEILVRNLRTGTGAQASRLLKLEEFNVLIRRRVQRIVDALGLTLPGEKLSEFKLQENTVTLAGEHGGGIFRKPDATLFGAGPNARMRKRVVVEADAVFDRMTMSAPIEDLRCVLVKSPAVVLFRGCVFERPLDATTPFIEVEAGAKVTLLGCVFRGGGTTASPVVLHAGLPADVQIAFSYDRTGNALLFNVGTATGTGNH